MGSSIPTHSELSQAEQGHQAGRCDGFCVPQNDPPGVVRRMPAWARCVGALSLCLLGSTAGKGYFNPHTPSDAPLAGSRRLFEGVSVRRAYYSQLQKLNELGELSKGRSRAILSAGVPLVTAPLLLCFVGGRRTQTMAGVASGLSGLGLALAWKNEAATLRGYQRQIEDLEKQAKANDHLQELLHLH